MSLCRGRVVIDLNSRPFLALLVVGMLFGISGPIAKILAGSFSAYEAVFVRFFVAFILVTFVSLLGKRKVSFKDISFQSLFYFSISYPISVLLFVLSVFNTKVALAIFTYYLADTTTSYFLGYLCLNERLTAHKVLGLVLAISSLFFFTNVFYEFRFEIGLVFGLLSGIVNGFASYFKKILRGSTSVMNLTILQTFAGMIVAAVGILCSGSFFAGEIATGDIVLAIMYGIIFLGITYLMIYGFQNINLNTGSIIISSELVFGPAFAYFILSEGLTIQEFIGSIFIILAIIVVNLDRTGIEKTTQTVC